MELQALQAGLVQKTFLCYAGNDQLWYVHFVMLAVCVPQGFEAYYLACPNSLARAQLVGAAGYSPALFTEVAQNYTVPHRPGAIDTQVAKYLAGAPPPRRV